MTATYPIRLSIMAAMLADRFSENTNPRQLLADVAWTTRVGHLFAELVKASKTESGKQLLIPLHDQHKNVMGVLTGWLERIEPPGEGRQKTEIVSEEDKGRVEYRLSAYVPKRDLTPQQRAVSEDVTRILGVPDPDKLLHDLTTGRWPEYGMTFGEFFPFFQAVQEHFGPAPGVEKGQNNSAEPNGPKQSEAQTAPKKRRTTP